MGVNPALRRAYSFLLVFTLAGGLVATAPQPASAAEAPVDGAPGVIRVIVWGGVTKDFLGDLRHVASYDHVYTYEIIRGAAVAVRGPDAADVIAFAKARGLKAVRDSKVQAELQNSAKTAHVKASGAGSPGAWALGYTGRGVTVGIIDTGLDDEHAGLDDIDDNPATSDPKVLAFRDWVGANGEANIEPYDDNDHGSHVGGIATGTGGGLTGDGPNGNRHVGMAYEANLAGLKVLGAQGTGNVTDIVAAIDWAAANATSVDPPIRVLNLSIGQIGVGGEADGTSPQAQAVDAASAMGIVTAASAGNGDTDGVLPNVTGGNISSPGDARTSIGVCSSDSAAPPAEPSYSDWDSEGPTVHNKPDVCAPGDSVMSVNANNTNPGTPSSGYVAFGGTSMSSPHVAGIAALVIQAVPHITPAQLKQVVIETAAHYNGGLGHSDDSGWGEVHAREAIELAIARFGGGPQPLVADIGGPYYVAQNEIRPLAATATGGNPPYVFAWDLDGDGFFDDGTGPGATFTDTAALAVHTLRVRATDAEGVVSTDTTTIEVLAPVSVFLDDVESGPGGWAASSSGASTAAGWHQETFHAQSATHAWYAGNDVAETYTNSENVSLQRSFDLSTGAAATSGQLLLKFAMSGTLEPTFDFLRVEAGATELARYDDTTRNAWSTKTLDLTQYQGQTVNLTFRFTSDDLVGPGEFTGPFVDDIRIVGTVAPTLDTTPPGAIGDLVAAVPTRTTAQLTWTATGDDGGTGTATSYDLRRSLSPIDAGNFALAAAVPGTPNPKPAGGAESFTVTGLAADTTNYFAIKAQDEQTNLGPISNVTSITTLPPDVTPPSQVTGLAATAGNRSVSLGWTTATDDDGVIDHYKVYVDGAITATATNTNATIGGLNNGQTYTFEVSALDPSSNEGLRSAPVLATPVEPPATPGWTQFHGNAARTGTGAPRAGIAVPRLLQELTPGGSVTSSPLIADLDGDGKLDVVSVSDLTQAGGRITVRAYKQGATGLGPNPMWTHEVPVGVIGGNPTNGIGSLAVGDLDQDGDAEVVVYSNYLLNLGAATSNDGRLSVLNGQTGAAIGFIAGVPDLPIGLPSTPAIGDVTGDGVPEIVITRQTGGADATTGYYVMSARLVNGALVKGFDTRLGTVALFASPALAELRSSHGGLEVVVAEGSGSNTAGRVYICKPDGGAAVCNESIATTTGLRGVAVADLDGDGIPEIVANGRTGQSLNVVRTTAPLTLVSRADSFLWNTPSLGDVDADGLADIVNVNYSEFVDDAPKQGDVRLRGFNGTAISDKGTLARPPAPGTTSTQAQGGGALVDLIGGTGPELVFGSADSKLVAAKFSSPPTALWSLDLSGIPVSPVAAGDVNGDGRADLVVGTSNGRLVVVGNRPPTLAAIGPRTVAESATLTFTISGADPDGDPLTYSAPTLPTGATFNPSTRTFTWTPGFDDAGTHTARFEVSDGGGSAAEDVTITVTNVPRAPVITLPAEGAVLADTTPDISGTSEGVSVEVLVDGTLAGTVPVVGGAWTLTAALLGDGSHAAAARALDAGGTASALSAARNFTIDTTGPAAPAITAPTEGALLSDTTPTISGSAEAESSVEVLVDGVTVGSVTATGGAWSYTLTAAQSLADGPHAATATATDGVGNVSAPSAPRAFAVDTAAPAPPIVITPADGSTIADSTPEVSGSAEPGSEVEVFVDGTTIGSVTAVGGAWSITSSALADGAHAATATATDGAGNVSGISAPSTFTIDTTGPAAPAITAPVEGALLATRQPTISGEAETGSTVEVLVDGVVVGTVAANSPWSYTLTAAQALADGTHAARARATDALGNVGALSAVRSFRVDATAPAAPAFTAPAEGAVLNDTTPELRGTAETGSTVEVLVNGVLVGSVGAPSGTWSYTLTDTQALSDGVHAATAGARDAAGNTGALSAPRTFSVDVSAPPAPVLAFDDTEIRQSESVAVTLTGTRETGASLRITISDQVAQTPDVILNLPAGAAGFTAGPADLTGMALGRLDARAVATDAFGRVSPAGLAQARKVPDAPGPVPPRVIIRDGDGMVSPALDDPAAIAIDVTHLGPTASADVTLLVSDGVSTLTIPMGTLAVDVPATATVDMTSLRDGTITATATADGAAGSATTILDRSAPTSVFLSTTTAYCVVIPLIGFTNCRLDGEATDASSGVALVYVTGQNLDQGGTYARHATLASPGATRTTFSLSGARLATLTLGTWRFTARGEDMGGNFEATGGTATIIVL